MNPQLCYENVKTFLDEVLNGLQIEKAKMLKPEHQTLFLELRLDYLDLLAMTSGYCETAIPVLQFSKEKLENAQEEIDIKLLLLLAEKVDPEELINKCTALQKRILDFNGQIELDSTYTKKQKTNWSKVSLGIGGVLLSIGFVCLTSWAFPLEAAIVAGVASISSLTLPSLVQLITGAVSLLSSDVKQLAQELGETKKQVDNLRIRLSGVKMNNEKIKLALDVLEVKCLSDYYSKTLKSVEELHEVCQKSVGKL